MMQFQGTITEDIRDSVPDWGPYRAPQAPDNAPNVLYLLWDDIGIATWDCFGGMVEMPTMTRIAERGIRLSQFHTTALCSPTRAALLTGRNATSVGVSSVVNMAQGYPGHSGRIPADTALVSEVLAERGWATYAVGKWHLTPPEDCHAAGSRRYWPLSRGFDRFYGFLDGMTDQWYPNLVSDSRPMTVATTAVARVTDIGWMVWTRKLQSGAKNWLMMNQPRPVSVNSGRIVKSIALPATIVTTTAIAMSDHAPSGGRGRAGRAVRFGAAEAVAAVMRSRREPRPPPLPRREAGLRR